MLRQRIVEHLRRRVIVRAALVTDKEVFCLLRKRKLRHFARNSQIPIPYINPILHFEMIKRWGLEKVLFRAPQFVIQRVYRAINLISVYRPHLTAGAACDAPALVPLEHCVPCVAKIACVFFGGWISPHEESVAIPVFNSRIPTWRRCVLVIHARRPQHVGPS